MFSVIQRQDGSHCGTVENEWSGLTPLWGRGSKDYRNYLKYGTPGKPKTVETVSLYHLVFHFISSIYNS